MKTTITLITTLAALALCGCSTTNQKNAGAFLSKVAGMNITAADVTQSTTTPFYAHQESLTGLHHQQGQLSIENLKASFTIPLWGVKWDFSASAITAEDPQAIAALARATNLQPAPAPDVQVK